VEDNQHRISSLDKENKNLEDKLASVNISIIYI
jgi:hypothetical protein